MCSQQFICFGASTVGNNFTEIEIPPEVSILCSSSSTTFLLECHFDAWQSDWTEDDKFA